MPEYISPLKDIVFKYIFGRQENSDCLLSFINAVLTDSDMNKIKRVEILNPFNEKEFINDKLSVLDIKAEDEQNNVYNIEIQLSGNVEYKYRSLYYWSLLYSSQLKESEDYGILKPVICINILNFDLIKGLDLFHTCFLAYESKHKEILLTEHFQLHFLEIPKFEKNKNQVNDALRCWFEYLISEGKEEEIMKGVLDKSDDIQKAHKEYKKFTGDDKMRDLYEARLKFKRDQESLLRHAKMDGINEGKVEIAKSMLKNGETIEKISKYTGLSINEIEDLK